MGTVIFRPQTACLGPKFLERFLISTAFICRTSLVHIALVEDLCAQHIVENGPCHRYDSADQQGANVAYQASIHGRSVQKDVQKSSGQIQILHDGSSADNQNAGTEEEGGRNGNTEVSSKNDVAFGSISSQSLDPVLVGAISGAKEGEVVGPVKGNIGVYVLKVNGRETGSFYTEDDAKVRENQVSTYQLNMLPYVFTEKGEVVDNRARFF